jgi:N-carbamoyl-L-amino-acid hydrolase
MSAAMATAGADAALPSGLQINGPRLLASLAELGGVGALPGGGVNRLALSDADRQGRDWTVARMRELGLRIEVDAIGNVFGHLAGQADGPPVMTGSHIDTVRTGGLYDGNYGVLAGLEVVATLRDAGLLPVRPMAVAFFTNEEGARFQPDMMGSLVCVGGLPLSEALAIRDADGLSVGSELQRIGYQGPAPVGRPQVDSFVELHIEQGPVLAQHGVPVGVVEGVQGISWTEFTLDGQSNHAGTTPMDLRHDAALVAAQVVVFVRELAQRLGGGQLATVGALRLTPNLVNVIASKAVFTVDLRHTNAAVLAQAEAEVLAFAVKVARSEGVRLHTRSLARFDPVAFAPLVVDLVERQAQALGCSHRRMPSGAGHDAQMLARVCPSGMIFVPSVGGLSHNVREHTEPADLVQGAQLLLRVMWALAHRPA